MKLYYAHGVVRSFNFKYLRNITPHDQVWFNVDAFVMANGNSFLDKIFFTNDQSIEAVHSIIGGKNPFQRQQLAIGHPALFQIIDDQGRTFQIGAGQSILGTIDAGYVKTIQLLSKKRDVITLHVGTAASASLNALDSRPAVGINAQIQANHTLNSKESLTLALGGALIENLPIYLNERSPHFADHSLDYHYGAALLFTRLGRKGGKTTFGFDIAAAPPPLMYDSNLKAQAAPALTGNDPSSPLRGFLQTKMSLTRFEDLFGFGFNHTTPCGFGYQFQMAEDFDLRWQLGGSTNRQEWTWRMAIFAPTQILKRRSKRQCH